MRCKRCLRFFNACTWLFKSDQQLRVMYRKKFKNDQQSLRAFIVRSHAVRRGHIVCWIRPTLQAMLPKTHPDVLELLCRKKDNEGTPTARTVTQERPIVRGRTHVCRVAIPLDTMSAPM